MPIAIAPIRPKSQVPQRSGADDEEYRRNYDAFEYVHALYALDNGWTGQGVTVGVADDGVVENAELRGQISPLSRDFGTTTTGSSTTARNQVGDAGSDHGTLVAGIIAGLNDGMGIQGIAPGAKIAALRVSDINTDTGVETLGRRLPAALDYAAANGIKVVNASLAKVDASQPSRVWSDMVARYTAAGGLFVNSAGNDGGANAKSYLDLNDANRDGWLFVVALDTFDDGPKIAHYSNRCGSVAMERCVGAIGTQGTMDVDGRLVLFGGSSAAAPQVSGLAALILSKWPQLSGVQAGQVILNTARDIGDPGTDPIYGRGLIDVEAALSPVSPTLSNGVRQTALTQAAMFVPDAVGGASTTTAIKAMLQQVTVLDAYGRDFTGDLSGLVAHPEQRRGAFTRQFAAGTGAGATRLATEGFATSLGYTRYRSGPEPTEWRSRLTWGEVTADLGATRLRAGFSSQDAVLDEAMGLAPASDVTIAYAPSANLSFGVERRLGSGRVSASALASDGQAGSARGVMLGWTRGMLGLKAGLIEERGALFGTPVGLGPLRFGDGARSAFLEVSRGVEAGDWSLAGYASVGATRLMLAGDTLLTSATTIVTQRAGFSASRVALGGRVRLGLALPLTALSGEGSLTYASGYDLASRSLTYAHQRLDLTGGYDPVLSLGYEQSGPGGTLRLAGAASTSARDVRALGSWHLTLP